MTKPQQNSDKTGEGGAKPADNIDGQAGESAEDFDQALTKDAPEVVDALAEQDAAAAPRPKPAPPGRRNTYKVAAARKKAAKALVPAPRRSVAKYDPLQTYINQVRRYSLITPEEEHELAVKYQKNGDIESARRLVTANLRLVVKIAHEYRKAYRNLLDLIQEGNIGLMHAVKKFDPFRGVKLSSYAAWWIRAYILKFILNNWRLVKIGTTQVQRKLFFNLRKEVERLQAMGIDSPGPKLLAQRLDVPEDEVTSMQRRLAASDLSLDAPVNRDESGSSSRLDFVTEHRFGPDREFEEREFSELLKEKIGQFGQTLTGRDREIFELRTVADEPQTLQQIGDRYGITRERARQIERRMMDRMRDHLREELGDAVQIALGIKE